MRKMFSENKIKDIAKISNGTSSSVKVYNSGLQVDTNGDVTVGRDLFVEDELVIDSASKIVDPEGNPIQFGGAGHTVTFKYNGENSFIVSGYDANGEFLSEYLNETHDRVTFNNCVCFTVNNGYIITDHPTIYFDNVEHEIQIDTFGDDDPEEGYMLEVSNDSQFFPAFGNVHIRIWDN